VSGLGSEAAFLERLQSNPQLEAEHQRLARLALALPLAEGEDQGAGRAILGQLGKAGLLGLFGGRGLPECRALCAIRETLAYRSPFADGLFAVQGLGCAPIALAGSAGIRMRVLEAGASGAAVAAFALTEAEAGSDLRSMRTRATRIEGGYELEGEKKFISNAPWMDFAVVFAVVDSSSEGFSLAAFLLERGTPGLEPLEPAELLAAHPIGGLRLSGCRVPDSNLLGSPGQGMKLAHQTLECFRPSVGAAAVGMAQRALDAALEFVSSRIQFGQALKDFQGLRFQLAECATELEAARLLVYHAALAVDRGAPEATRLGSMAKLKATETAQQVVDRALQLHGARGLVRGSLTERLYREVRALRIYEGTSEIQKLIIARELLDHAGG